MDLRLLALWILVFAAGAGLGWWVLVAIRVLRDLPSIPRAPQGLALPVPDPAPLVSVVIPAHNEEAHAARAPFGVRIETVAGVKRYVREETP